VPQHLVALLRAERFASPRSSCASAAPRDESNASAVSALDSGVMTKMT
jgi:hypothetical protein